MFSILNSGFCFGARTYHDRFSCGIVTLSLVQCTATHWLLLQSNSWLIFRVGNFGSHQNFVWHIASFLIIKLFRKKCLLASLLLWFVVAEVERLQFNFTGYLFPLNPYFYSLFINKRAQRALDRSPETKDFKFPFFIALSTTGDTWQSKS